MKSIINLLQYSLLCYLGSWANFVVVRAKLPQSCLTLCDPMDCSPSGSSVQGILQARELERVAVFSSKGSS